MVVYLTPFRPSTRETEADRSLSVSLRLARSTVPGQPGVHNETLSWKTKPNQNKNKTKTTKQNQVGGEKVYLLHPSIDDHNRGKPGKDLSWEPEVENWSRSWRSTAYWPAQRSFLYKKVHVPRDSTAHSAWAHSISNQDNSSVEGPF